MKTTRKCLSVTGLVLALMLAAQGNAYELSAGDQDKLNNAKLLAERVFQETKDADGAVKVLEEAGIERLQKGRPTNMPLQKYLDLLEAYAGLLANTAEGGDLAANYLKIIIKNDSKRLNAYRSLGELYYRRFHAKSDPQYRRIYQGAFTKYVERLLAKGTKTVLPRHIVEAVYPQFKDVCSLVRGLNDQGKLGDLERLFNPEQNVSLLDLTDPKGIHTTLGASFTGFTQTVARPIRQSRIDIDNDAGVELRYSANTADGCQRNLFYKKFGNQTALLSNKLLNEYYKSGRICNQDTLQVVRFGSTNFLVEKQQLSLDEIDLQVFEVRPSGEYVLHCRISPPTMLQQNLVKQCQAAVCAHLAGKIDTVVAAEGQAGSEWLVTDTNAQRFVDEAYADPGLKPFIESAHQYLVDLDNDGERELITRWWQQQANGEMEYQYRLFKTHNGLWQPWRLPSAQEGMSIGPWQWFFAETFESENYIVSYTVSKDVDAGSSPIAIYTLVVFQIKQGELIRLGEIRTHQALELEKGAGQNPSTPIVQ